MSYSGVYVYDLIDTYGVGLGVFVVAIFETIVIMWIYGVGRFTDDLKFMLNSEPNICGKLGWFLTQICWSITPILLSVILAITCYYWKEPTYNDVIHYPEWIHGIGWFLTLIGALQVGGVLT